MLNSVVSGLTTEGLASFSMLLDILSIPEELLELSSCNSFRTSVSVHCIGVFDLSYAGPRNERKELLVGGIMDTVS